MPNEDEPVEPLVGAACSMPAWVSVAALNNTLLRASSTLPVPMRTVASARTSE